MKSDFERGWDACEQLMVRMVEKDIKAGSIGEIAAFISGLKHLEVKAGSFQRIVTKDMVRQPTILE
jgi:hypothetical protein